MYKYLILITPFLIVLLYKIMVCLGSKSVCIWYLLTGHKCLGCGMTTAMVYLLQGKFMLAYKSNHLIIIVAPILLYCWLDTLRKEFW